MDKLVNNKDKENCIFQWFLLVFLFLLNKMFYFILASLVNDIYTGIISNPWVIIGISITIACVICTDWQLIKTSNTINKLIIELISFIILSIILGLSIRLDSEMYLFGLILVILCVLMLLICSGSLILRIPKIKNNYVLLVIISLLIWILMLVLGSIYFLKIFDNKDITLLNVLYDLIDYDLSGYQNYNKMEKLSLILYGKIVDMSIFAYMIELVRTAIKAINYELKMDNKLKNTNTEIVINKDILNEFQIQGNKMEELLEEQQFQLNEIILLSKKLKEK